MPPGGEERAVDFYEGLLGLQRVPKPPHLEKRGGCWFESGQLRVHLGVEEPFLPATKAHPAFLVEDVASLMNQLDRAGVPIVEDEPLPGYLRFYGSDPFGNRLEFLSASPVT